MKAIRLRRFKLGNPFRYVRDCINRFSAWLQVRIDETLEDLPDMLRAFSSSYGNLREETHKERLERLNRWFVKRDQMYFGRWDPYCVRNLVGLADFYRAEHRFWEAEKYYQRAVAILERHSLQPGDLRLGDTYTKIAHFYRQYAKNDLAIAFYHKSIAGNAQQFGEDAIELTADLRCLAEVCLGSGDGEQALQAYMRELAIKEKVLGPSHMDLTGLLTEIIRAAHATGNHTLAARCEEQWRLVNSVGMVEDALGKDHHAVARDLEPLAAFYHKCGKYEIASRLEKQARLVRLAYKVQGADYPGLIRDLRELADLYEKRDEPGDATVAFRARARADHGARIRQERGNNANTGIWR